MFRNILNTLVTRIFAAIVSFVVLIITSKFLGAEGVGTISLIILGITMVLIISNFIGGGAMIYLIPRYDLYTLVVVAYFWSILSTIIVTVILHLFKLIPTEYTIHVFFLSLLNAWFSVNLTALIGREQINKANFAALFQSFFLLLILAISFFIVGKTEVFSYIIALYASYIAVFIVSLYLLWKLIKFGSLSKPFEVIRESLKYGSYVQLANILQLLNYRLNYFIIKDHIGTAALGIFALGVQLSEGLWIVSRSISTVQYARISNSGEPEYAKNITVLFFKLSFIITLLILIPMIILPEGFYTVVFSKDFTNINLVIILLSPGIIAVSANNILSHYFSGIGKHYYNTLGSLIGFVFIAVVGFIIIPLYGLKGAATASSVSYCSSFLFQFIIFLVISKTKWREFLLSNQDFKNIKRIFIQSDKK